jgi:hypothetical protein
MTIDAIYQRLAIFFLSTLSLLFAIIELVLNISFPWLRNVFPIQFALFASGYTILLLDIIAYYVGDIAAKYTIKFLTFLGLTRLYTAVRTFISQRKIIFQVGILFVVMLIFAASTNFLFVKSEYKPVIDGVNLVLLSVTIFVANILYKEHKEKRLAI